MKVASLGAGLGNTFIAGCDGSPSQGTKNARLLTRTPTSTPPGMLPTGMIPESLGVNVQFSATDTSAIATKLTGIGIGFARFDMLWNLVEHVQGQYDFSIYEPIVSALAARRIRPLVILDYNNPLYENTQAPPFDEVGIHSEQARQAFARFAAAAVAHFKAVGMVWEIWNEPDNPRFWHPKPDPDNYMALAKTAIAAMRQADPQAIIVGPALVGLEPRYQDAWNFLARCFALGLPGLVDAISVHSYRLGPPESATDDYQRLRALLAQYAPRKANLPILCSEWGYSLTWVSEQQQAEYFTRLYLINLLNRLPLTIWYNWRDGPDPKQIEDNFGLVSYSNQPKPVYFAAQTLAHELAHLSFGERISLLSNDDYALLFTDGSGSAKRRSIWTAGNSHTVTLPVSGTSVKVTNLTGETRILPVINGQLTLEISSSPQYLEA